MFSLKNKIALWIVVLWVVVWLLAVYITVAAGSPSKFLFRQILVMVFPPIFFLWITDTIKPLKAWYKARFSHE